MGDDDQSIYRFRGAEVKNIVTFPDTFPGTKVVRLEQNYRSTGIILHTASEVVAHNRSRLGKTLRPTREEGVKVKLRILEDQTGEADYCASLLSEGNPEGTAILYRTNAQSAAFETCFLRRGIPYKVVGALRFYEREEIKDALALLALLQNPKDEVAFRRVVNKPSRGVGAASINKISGVAGKQSGGNFIAACSLAADSRSGKGARGAGEFAVVMEELERLVESSDLASALQEGLRLSGLLEYHRQQDEVSMTQKSDNLQQLAAAAAEYPPGREGLSSFLEDLELDRSRLAGSDSGDKRGVTLITMHNTKGLEFDRVIITGMEEGLFPGRGAEDEEELEEERRIFYVSITRARQELFLTGCRRRTIWGRTETRLPSRFLRELPGDVLEEERTSLSTRDYWKETSGFSGDRNGRRGTSLDYEGFPPGTVVYHDDYGSGAVLSGKKREGELVITVQFETGRKAEFLPRYSGLERIQHDW